MYVSVDISILLFPGMKGHIYIYDWPMLIYGKTQHNIVIILQLKIDELQKKKNTGVACHALLQMNIRTQ